MSKEEIALQITLSALDNGVLELVEQNETNNNIDNLAICRNMRVQSLHTVHTA